MKTVLIVLGVLGVFDAFIFWACAYVGGRYDEWEDADWYPAEQNVSQIETHFDT